MRNAKLERTIIVITILFINICLLIPVWQSARNSQLRWELAQSEKQLKEKEEQKMVLNASIAKKTTPEYLIEQAAVQNIVFKQIDAPQQRRFAGAGRADDGDDFAVVDL